MWRQRSRVAEQRIDQPTEQHVSEWSRSFSVTLLVLGLAFLVAFVVFAIPFFHTVSDLGTPQGQRWPLDRWVISRRIEYRYLMDLPPRVRLLRRLSYANVWLGLLGGLVGIAIGFWRRSSAQIGAFIGAISMPALVSVIVKPLVHRQAGGSTPAVDSFPSSHVALFAGLACAILVSLPDPRARAMSAVPLMGAVGLYAYYTALAGSHFLSDCVGAVLLSTAVVALASSAVTVVAREFFPSGRFSTSRWEATNP